MKTLFEIIRSSEKFLGRRGIDRPRREAEEVIADALNMRRIDLYLYFDRPLCEKELDKLRKPIQRRANFEPTAYIAGSVKFAGLKINVNPNVLIPRPETEILVENIARQLKGKDLENKVLWDMCCGSGCIGHALKKQFPELRIFLSDICEKALDVARVNGKNVVLRQGDLFAPFVDELCDFFVCNPPYVTEEEYKTLTPEVKAEPKIALLGGLTFYQRIATQLPNYLKQGGMAWFEIGAGQGEDIKKIFNQGRVENDWAGNNRFFFLEMD